MQAEHTFNNFSAPLPPARTAVPPGTCLPLDAETRDPAGCVAPYRIGNEPPEDLSLRPASSAASTPTAGWTGSSPRTAGWAATARR